MSNAQKDKILFFVGEDITAHLILNRAVKQVIDAGFTPVLYFARHVVTANANLPELKEFALHDRILLNETVYPFIDEKPSVCAKNRSPEQLVEVYGLESEIVPNVNDPEFVKKIAARDDIHAAISLRSTQIFHQPIVDAVNHGNPDGIFFNLHSGILPDFRGVMPTMRTMFEYATGKRKKPPQYGVTMHKVDSFSLDKKDKGIDTGNILEVTAFTNETNPTAFAAQVGLVKAGSQAIQHLLDNLVSDFAPIGHPQNEDRSGYYTFPTREEMDEWKSAGIVLFNEKETIRTLVEAFSGANTSHGKKLEDALVKHFKAWHKKTGIDTENPAKRTIKQTPPPAAPTGTGPTGGDVMLGLAGPAIMGIR